MRSVLIIALCCASVLDISGELRPKSSVPSTNLSLRKGSKTSAQLGGLTERTHQRSLLFSAVQTKGTAEGSQPDIYRGKENSSRAWSVAAALTVPIIWGTYSPVVKSIYSNAEVLAPPPILFNFLTYMVSFLTLNLAQKLFFPGKNAVVGSSKHEQTTFSSPLELKAGAELGLWLFFGSTVQIMGIQSTSADRAAILVQLTTILVPLLDTILSKRTVPIRTWLSCVLALLGVSLVTLDGTSSTALGLGLGHPNEGDMLVLLSACFYSMHVVRLGQTMSSSGDVSPVRLARIKSLTELTACVVTMLLFIPLAPERVTELVTFSSAAFDGSLPGFGLVVLSVLWNGCAATALTNSLQAFGQKEISPTKANLLYSTQPLWAALFSFGLLGEALEPIAIAGLVVLAGAVAVAARE